MRLAMDYIMPVAWRECLGHSKGSLLSCGNSSEFRETKVARIHKSTEEKKPTRRSLVESFA